ncbi:unhealthy ribosome biogenesis protein 2 homolog [Diadema antillarum]|uniref:unhealthy ribosome biogenesis protein 2 homolog n=1 Tax=Diadema antillarum TaxID=105358 RepID=UPI003A8C03BE
MAARYAGLYKHLKDSGVPWEDRVKLARFGWVSNQCFLPNKHQVLLDWMCHGLATIDRSGAETAAEESLWLFLHDALKSREIQGMQLEGKSLNLRGNLCSALTSALGRQDLSDVVIGCCDRILANNKLRFVQNTSFDSFVSLTVTVTELSAARCSDGTCPEIHAQLLKVLSKSLAKCTTLYQQQQNGKKAYCLLYEKLLLPVIKLHSAIRLHHHGNKSEQVVLTLNALSSFIRNVIFERDLAEAYKTHLMPSEGEKQKKEGRIWTDVAAKFMSFLASQVNDASVICGLPLLNSAFIASFKPFPNLAFALLQKLCSLLATEGGSQAVPDYKEMCDVKLEATQHLLKQATDHQCYAVTEDDSTRSKKLEWFQTLFSTLLKTKRKDNPAWYNSLCILFSVDHNIMASHLQEVWPCLLATSIFQDSSSMETGGGGEKASVEKVMESRDAFQKTVIETYTKLRQMARLVKTLLSAVLTREEFSFKINLPTSFYTSFAQAVESLTPGSSVAICDMILEDLLTNYVPKIVTSLQTRTEPARKKKKKKLAADDISPKVHDEEDVSLRFETVATILDIFLRNAKLVDAAEVGHIKGQVSSLLRKMSHDVLRPLLKAVCSENQSFTRGAVLLCYSWGELLLLLRQHTNLMEKDPPTKGETPPEHGFFSYLHSYVDAATWANVVDLMDRTESGELLVLKGQLLWQQARGLSLFSDVRSVAVRESLSGCVLQALGLAEEGSCQNLGTWDGLFGHISRSNHYTAMLHSTLLQVPTLLAFFDDAQCQATARLICQAVCTQTSSSGQCGTVTAWEAATSFLDAEACKESRGMQTALIETVGERLREILCRSISPMNAKKVGLTGGVKHDMMRLSNLASVSHQSKETKHIKDLLEQGTCLLEVLRHLPLAHLSPSNQTECLVVLGAVDQYVTRLLHSVRKTTRSRDLLGLSAALRNLQAVILRGVHSVDVVADDDLSGLYSRFLAILAETSLEVDSMHDGPTEFIDATENLALLCLKKKVRCSTASDNLSNYLVKICDRLTPCIEKLRSSKIIHSPPGAALLLSIGATLVQQIHLAGRRRTPNGESRSSPAVILTSQLKASLIGILKRLLATPEGVMPDEWWMKSVMKAARTLLMSRDGTSPPQKMDKEQSISEVMPDDDDAADDEDDNEDDEERGKGKERDSPDDSHKTSESHWQCFSDCHERALSLSLQRLLNIEEDDNDHLGVTISCLEYLASYCTVRRTSSVAQRVWDALHLGLITKSSEGHRSVRQQLEGLLLVTLNAMATADLRSTLQTLLTQLDMETESRKLESLLATWQLLPSATLSMESYMVVVEFAPRVLRSCQTILQQTVGTHSTEGALLAALLSTVAKFVAQGKDLLPVEHALPSMHQCLAVPFDTMEAVSFPACFTAAFQILNSLLLCYPGAVLRALPAYISCVNHILSLTSHTCTHTISRPQELSDEQLFSCAENMQRLYSLLASLKRDLSQYGIYLVTEYVSGLQRGTLLPLVKKPLVEGVYKIVDVCDDKTLPLLHVTLPVNLKEIFKAFYADYKKHHKYTGHV